MSSDYKRNPWVRFQWAVRHEGQPLWTHLTIPKRNTVTLEVIKKKTKLDSPCRCMASLQCELSCVWAACTLHWKVSTDEDTPEAVKVNQKFAQRIWQLGLSVVTSQKQGKSSQPFLCSMWEEVTWSTRYFFSVNSRPQLRHLQASTPVPWTQLCHNMVFLYWVSRSQFMSWTNAHDDWFWPRKPPRWVPPLCCCRGCPAHSRIEGWAKLSLSWRFLEIYRAANI